MWRKVRLFMHKLLPMSWRLRLLEKDLEQLEKDDSLPSMSDVVWVETCLAIQACQDC
jgi:hypothetical protein